MSKAVYTGLDEIARKLKKIYEGVDDVARKVKKAYVGIDNVARQFYSSELIVEFSGDHTISDINVGGVDCKLLTIVGSGTLEISDSVPYWMCGGGGSGQAGKHNDSTKSGSGGEGGAGGHFITGVLQSGKYVVTIGAGGEMCHYASGNNGGATKLLKDNVQQTANGGGVAVYYSGKYIYGGSTGGAGGYISGGATSTSYNKPRKASGLSTIPFMVASLKKHCAGGGGGDTAFYENGVYRHNSGGKGGSDGSDGSAHGTSILSSGIRAVGGEYGGGNGGIVGAGSDNYPTAATFYGSGGGAGSGAGYPGYQGVLYILIDRTGKLIEPTKIIDEPKDVYCNVEDTVSISVNATNVAKYKWFYRKSGSSSWTSSYQTGYNSNTVSFKVTEALQNSTWRCTLTDMYHNVLYTREVSLLEPVPLTITKQPEDVTVI